MTVARHAARALGRHAAFAAPANPARAMSGREAATVTVAVMMEADATTEAINTGHRRRLQNFVVRPFSSVLVQYWYMHFA